jgi:hypothetical protein
MRPDAYTDRLQDDVDAVAAWDFDLHPEIMAYGYCFRIADHLDDGDALILVLECPDQEDCVDEDERPDSFGGERVIIRWGGRTWWFVDWIIYRTYDDARDLLMRLFAIPARSSGQQEPRQ